jgi:hypothetical protein
MADVFTKTQKVIKVENSLAVTVDPAFAKEANLQAGIRESKVPAEFRKWVEKSLEEDAQSLRELANR